MRIKRFLKRLVITLAILVAVVVIGIPAFFTWLNNGEAVYRVEASLLDMDAAGSFPQTIVKVVSDTPQYVLEIHTKSNDGRTWRLPLGDYDYPPDVARYLEPSQCIESDNPVFLELAETIAPTETETIMYTWAVAQWVKKHIKYDSKLAQAIGRGEVDSQSALTTLQRGRGTCSEYANLFIAIMRAKGIPARFVHGKNYIGMHHAWAEVYVPSFGWMPVDPQAPSIGVSRRHIKLFAGADFVDIGVKLRDMHVKVKKIG